MRYGFIIPGGSVAEQLELAHAAEASGWDGVFVWEGGYAVDPWTLLSAVAATTERIRLGTMLTPIPWRRPWKLAAQVATLDHVSNGRASLAVGLGAPDPVLGTYGEPTDRRTRAELLDEGIDIVAGLWAGEKTYEGRHHRVDLTNAIYEHLRPVQTPRPPIWCVGAKDREASMRRILRCDGVLPTTMTSEGPRQSTPDEVADMIQWLDEHGGRRDGFDVVVEGETRPGDPGAVADWREAGATWWLESRWGPQEPNTVRERILGGPPTT